MRTVADKIELEELEIRAEALIAELQTTLTRIKELKADGAGSNLRRRSR